MPELIFNKLELLALFPKKINNLKVFTNPSTSSFNWFYYQKIKLPKKDKLILEIELTKHKNIPKDAIYLSNITRNRDLKEFKGMGGEVYQNLIYLLKEKGYNYILGIPSDEDPKIYNLWLKQGQIPYITLSKEEKQYFKKMSYKKDTLVHKL